MKVLVVAPLYLGSGEGIYKKVIAEANALGKIFGTAMIVFGRGREAICLSLPEEEVVESTNKSIPDLARGLLESEAVDVLYVRHGVPSFGLLALLKAASGLAKLVVYEIPTYPYFIEQLRASRRKYRAVGRIGVDLLFWPIIYGYIDFLFVIRSRRATYRFAKMVDIVNGVDTSVVKRRMMSDSGDPIRIATVGTLYPYHGYDRVLLGLHKCKESVNGRTVEFHVIGKSATIDDLREQSEMLGLKHVVFHGMKTSDELNEMFNSFDLGLGCLALHRRGADIDTTLKLTEYCCRGIPVLTSGASPLGDQSPATLYVDRNDEPIDLVEVLTQLDRVRPDQVNLLATRSRRELTWEAIFRRAFEEAGVVLPAGGEDKQ